MIWKSKLEGDDKIIAYSNNTIYKGNPKEDEMESVLNEFKNPKSTNAKLTGIPLAYIKEINLESGKNYIEILFGKESSEHLRINDEAKRNEIFEYLKLHIPNSKHNVEHYSKLKSAKKPLIAMGIISAIFIWTLYIADGIENGSQYEVSGGHLNSIAGIVLGLASLGKTKVIMIFGTFLSIAIIGFIQKIRVPKVVSSIKIRR